MPRPALCLALASLLALPAARATKGFPLPTMGFNTCNVGLGLGRIVADNPTTHSDNPVSEATIVHSVWKILI